jgi:hypothetical protein
MMASHLPVRLSRGIPVLILAGLLAACASSPSSNISLVPPVTAEQTSKDGLFLQPVKWTHTKPDCKGECPKFELDSIVFPGVQRLTELIDVALATMTGVSNSGQHPYQTVAEFESYFWKVAAPRDSVLLAAKARYRNRDLTVVELNTWQYMTGGAHGISATQFLNWDNRTGKVLGLDNVLLPGKTDAYTEALKRVHAEWMAKHPDALHDMASFRRLWPFQPSSNFAITDAGLVVKYDSYEIAPYSSGQPELLIPYSALQGILRPEFIPT